MDTTPTSLAPIKSEHPWGFWPTIGIGILAHLASNLVIFLITLPAAIIALCLKYKLEEIQIFSKSGFIFSITLCIADPIVVFVVVYFAKFRKELPLKDYFVFNQVSKSYYLKWLFIFALYSLTSAFICYLFKRSIPAHTIHQYQTAYFPALIWFAFLVVAPVTEELVFRGFLFKGIQASRLGNIAAVILTTLLWTSLHFQYDLFEIGLIFILGIILGIARLQSNSIYLPIMIHTLNNLQATIEVALATKK